MQSNHLILHCPLLLFPSIFPSMRIFSGALQIRWPKYWSSSFSINTSTEYSGNVSFRIDWFDLLVVQGALKSVLQHHSLKASILEVCRIPGVSGDPLAYLLAAPCHNMATACSVTLGAPVQQPWTKRIMRKLLGWRFMSHTTK